MSYPHDVSALFRETVERHRDRNALIWSRDSAVTFSGLDQLSDRVARFLIEQGVARGDRVCIRLDKCTLGYAAIIASLKIGAPYFVIDPANPEARARHMIEKCRPKVALSSAESPLAIPAERTFIVDREDELGILEGVPEGPLPPSPDITGADPAYIMFTSGSTGFPKGAVISHGNLLNFVPWVRTELNVTPEDVFTNVNPLYFDNSVFDIYGSLFNGASLVPFDAATISDPYAVIERIDALGCTIYFSVPSLLVYFQTLKLINPGVFRRIRSIVFGGEGYPKPKLRELYDCFAERAELVNVYGPTECTCICSAYRISEVDFADPSGYAPLGRLIPNFDYEILDENDEPVPAGQTGELCLAGPCVGLGYFDEPELTSRAFRQNPTHTSYHERIYCTGDVVRFDPGDGKIHFVGRKDNQIKHQGYRIELGEIEHALGLVPGVDEAVALHSTKEGFSLIIAVVASRDRATGDAMRSDVARFLPPYMIPGRIEVLERLPKNANGKVDRNLLKTRYC